MGRYPVLKDSDWDWGQKHLIWTSLVNRTVAVVRIRLLKNAVNVNNFRIFGLYDKFMIC